MEDQTLNWNQTRTDQALKAFDGPYDSNRRLACGGYFDRRGHVLPPVSLGDRLGLTGDDEATTTESVEATSADTTSSSSSAELTVNSAENVSIDEISPADFAAADTWQAASAALPGAVLGSVYVLDSRADAPPARCVWHCPPTRRRLAQPTYTDGTAASGFPSGQCRTKQSDIGRSNPATSRSPDRHHQTG